MEPEKPQTDADADIGPAGHRARLRERFLKAGTQGLADYELVELLLTLAIPRNDVKQPAKALIARFGNLRGILDAPIEKLQEVKGIGSVTPIALKIVREAATLYLQQAVEERDVFDSHDALERFFRKRMGALPHEIFGVAYVDSGNRMLRDGFEELEQGTVDRAAVYPRRVAEAALRRNAAAVVLAHNHPNGTPQPSEHDKVLTRALVLALQTLQIKVLDHLIITTDAVFSFRKEGLL